MIKPQLAYFLLLLLFICSKKTLAQDKVISDIDLWYNLDYEKLSENFQEIRKDTLLYKKYANAYVSKAKKQGDIIKQSDGLYLLGLISDEPSAIKYGDSIINLTEAVQNYIYPARAHLLKARNFGRIRLYSKALDELIQADHYATKSKNLDQKNRVNFFIGILKINLGELEDSLNRYKSTLDYFEKKNESNKKYRRDYLKSLFAVNNGYVRLKNYDSAYYYMKKGMHLSLKFNDSVYYGYFLLSSGLINHHQKKYQASIDSLNKFKLLFSNIIKDKNVAIADLYLGKTYYEQNDLEKSIFFLDKVDSIPPARMRSCYELLLKIYKEKKDAKKQVEYIDKILGLDSVINKDFKYLYKNIEKEYSTPNLIIEKEKIINSLRENKKTNHTLIIFLVVLLLIITSILFYNNRKRKIYKQRFLKFYNKHEVISKEQKVEKEKQNSEDIGIPEELIDSILEKLEVFEKNKGYLNAGLTITELAKNFNTNSRYLSKVVNIFKEKSFSNYINDLRIEYVIEELKQNRKFRKYTIKAIAHDIGFKSTEVFSKLFYKKTGIYPSFFLKQLEKKNNTLILI